MGVNACQYLGRQESGDNGTEAVSGDSGLTQNHSIKEIVVSLTDQNVSTCPNEMPAASACSARAFPAPEAGHTSPVWLTSKREDGGCVRRGSAGAVYMGGR